MGGLKVAAFCAGAVIAITLGGCSSFQPRSEVSSYEIAADAIDRQLISEHLIESLKIVYAPAKHAFFIQPAAVPFNDSLHEAFAYRNWGDKAGSLGWELEHALRRHGYAVRSTATQASLPLIYVFDRITEASYYASLCVADNWCVKRLYRKHSDGTLVGEGGTVRQPVRL